MIFLHFERGMNMAKITDINQLEAKKVEKFEEIAKIKLDTRILNINKKQLESKLEKLTKKEEKFNKYLYSANTGKGEYSEIQNLPNDIQDLIDKGRNLTDAEKEDLKEKKKLAIINAKKYEDEYKMLLETAIERDKEIKEYKKEIAKLRRSLTKKAKDEKNILSEIKKLDRKMKALQPEDEDVKILVKKNDNKEQN